jgi:uncharacterized lipoprotein
MNSKSMVSAGTRIALIAILATLAGCGAQQGLTINYAPSSVKSSHGAVDVSDFAYTAVNPKNNEPIPQNQIRNTAIGDIILDRPVASIVRDAVFTELRFVGIKVASDTRVLTGDVKDFLIDDLGYSIDWTYVVHYVVKDKATGAVVYESTKTVQRKTEKFGNPLGALNETIKLNIEQLIDDPEFVKAIN